LDRLSVTCRRGDVDNPRRIRAAEVREEHDAGARAAGEHRQHRVALAQPGCRQVLDLFLALHPAIVRDDDDVVLFDDEIVGRVFDRLFGFDESPSLVGFHVGV
jgi:hypothetical protein